MMEIVFKVPEVVLLARKVLSSIDAIDKSHLVKRRFPLLKDSLISKGC